MRRLTSAATAPPSSSAVGPWSTARPASIRTSHSRHPARLVEVVGDEDERDLEPLAQLEQRLLDRPGGARRRAPRSARRAAAPRGSSASARASIARCCSPTESRRRRARRSSSSRPASSSRRRDVGVAARELGGEADVVVDRALEQRRQLRHEHDLAPQLERVALADVARRGSGPSRSPGRRAGRAGAAASTCPSPRARRGRSRPTGSAALSSRSTGFPARARLTWSSSNSIAAIIGAWHRGEPMPDRS